MNMRPAPPNMTTAAGGAKTLPILKLLLGGALPPEVDDDMQWEDEAWTARKRRCILVVWFIVLSLQ